MSHPDLPDQDIIVADSAVPIHMASGWAPVEDVAASEPVPAPVAAPVAPQPAPPKPARRADSTETGA